MAVRVPVNASNSLNVNFILYFDFQVQLNIFI